MLDPYEAIRIENQAVNLLIRAAYFVSESRDFDGMDNDRVIRQEILDHANLIIERDQLDARLNDLVGLMLVLSDEPRSEWLQFGDEEECQWPLGCPAKGAGQIHKDFVNRFRRIKILPDVFSMQSDHLIARRWGVETKMVPLCRLHNNMKRDSLWVAIFNGEI
jgi:hypothetical protein